MNMRLHALCRVSVLGVVAGAEPPLWTRDDSTGTHDSGRSAGEIWKAAPPSCRHGYSLRIGNLFRLCDGEGSSTLSGLAALLTLALNEILRLVT
jgi:hypothetical protein